MTEGSISDKEVRIQIRFVIEPFEIAVEAASKESEAGATIAGLIKALQAKREEISTAISTLDISKFKPIGRKVTMEAEDPLEKVAARLSVDIEKLKKIFLVDAEKVFVVCKREKFGLKGAGEKAALTILYVYKFGLDKLPTHGEINEAYMKVEFKPRSFGASAKSNLERAKKIAVDKTKGTISIEPQAIPEAEKTIRDILESL